MEGLIHHSLKCCRTIGKTKVYYQGHKEASIDTASCHSLVALVDMDIIVSPMHVELGEVARTLEAMDQVIDEREWVVILLYDGIEGAV
jgi:hypothetical protein